jgi:hypothetical protein
MRVMTRFLLEETKASNVTEERLSHGGREPSRKTKEAQGQPSLGLLECENSREETQGWLSLGF